MNIVIITDESEKWIHKVIKRLIPYQYLENFKFVYIDNSSEDNSVPTIVSMIGREFLDEERYKFYINQEKKPIDSINEMIAKIVKNEKYVIIDKNMNKKTIEKAIKEIL